MTDQQIEDLYARINSLTTGVNNLKIQAGTIGTTQVAVSETLSLLIALSSEVRSFRASTNTDLQRFSSK